MNEKLKKKNTTFLQEKGHNTMNSGQYTNVQNDVNDVVYKLKLSTHQKICNRHKV